MANQKPKNMAAKEADATKMVTGIVRLSYANLWEPKAFNENKPKYSVSLIIPKGDKETLQNIKRCIKAAYDAGAVTLKGANGKSVPQLSALKTPLTDGDEKRPDDEAYANAMFVNATSVTAPQIVDRQRNLITTHSEIYSGVYARVSLNFYAFNVKSNKGIACGLGNVQKIRDGEPLGGRTRAEDDFDDYEDDDYEDGEIPNDEDDFLA